MIKKRIKMQLKKAVSTFAGTALSGILCAVLLTGCGTLQNGEMPLPAESETSRSNDQTEEKTKGEDAEDGEITGSTEKTDDTEETKTSGTGKTVPEIWNREWPSNVDLPSSYDYREHERAPKIGNQGSLGTCWAFASLTALESTLLPKQNEKIVLDQGEKFAIIVEIKTPDTVHPVAIEYDAGDGIAQVDLTDGEGYLSHNGSLWEHVEETQKCNLCLKVYTHTEK